MSFWVDTRSLTGRSERFFSKADTEEEARAEAEAHGLTVEGLERHQPSSPALPPQSAGTPASEGQSDQAGLLEVAALAVGQGVSLLGAVLFPVWVLTSPFQFDDVMKLVLAPLGALHGLGLYFVFKHVRRTRRV